LVVYAPSKLWLAGALSLAMPLSAARLPIVRPCPDEGAMERSGDARWCRGCAKVVHDFSAMTEAEVRRLLERSAGTSMCVTYRVRRDGTIRMREAPPRALTAACGALLTACAGHLEEDIPIAVPDDCIDARGCDDSLARWWSAPNEDAAEGADADAHRDRASAGAHEPAPTVGDVERVDFDIDPNGRARTHAGSDTVRIDFALDPQESRVVGLLAVDRDEWHDADGRPRFVPTKELIAQWIERIRARRR
jgi:hypothetical protein